MSKKSYTYLKSSLSILDTIFFTRCLTQNVFNLHPEREDKLTCQTVTLSRGPPSSLEGYGSSWYYQKGNFHLSYIIQLLIGWLCCCHYITYIKYVSTAHFSFWRSDIENPFNYVTVIQILLCFIILISLLTTNEKLANCGISVGVCLCTYACSEFLEKLSVGFHRANIFVL